MHASFESGNSQLVGWFHFLGDDRALEREIRERLTAVDLHLCSPRDANGGNHGVVCFSDVNEVLLALLRQLRESRQCRVLALGASSSSLPPNSSWRLINAGASDVLVWRDHETVPKQIRAKLARWVAIDEILKVGVTEVSLVGDSPPWLRLLRTVVEAAHFTKAPILLVGESGTGKELLARLIHAVSCPPEPRRTRGQLITVDCSTIVPELSGSELFGHERGAFTHAVTARDGAFALADGGTLFLDEVGELTLALQAQLLRAVQEKTYKRIGGNVWQSTDFRLVCATNRDLSALVEKGQFRFDLYHRIAGWVFRSLPLSERPQDILPLARHFIKTTCESELSPEFDEPVREYLQNRTYPGNIRELSQLIQRIAHRHVGSWPITVGDIPQQDLPLEGTLERSWPDGQLETVIANALALGIGLREISQAITETAIRLAVQSEQGNLQRAARRLGVTDRALQMRRASAKLRDYHPEA